LKNIQFGAEPGCRTKVLYISSTSSHYKDACKDFKPVNNLLALLGINSFEELAKEKYSWYD